MHKNFLQTTLSLAVFTAFACGAQYARAMDPEDDFEVGGVASQGPAWADTPVGAFCPPAEADNDPAL